MGGLIIPLSVRSSNYCGHISFNSSFYDLPHISDRVSRGTILLSCVSFMQHYCATCRHYIVKIIRRQRVSIWLWQRKETIDQDNGKIL